MNVPFRSLITRRALLGLVLAAAFLHPVFVGRALAQAPAETPSAQSTEGAAHEAGAEHGAMATVAKVVNFAALVGLLVYFLRAPIVQHLAGRRDQVRRDLVDANGVRDQAQSQLDAIRRQLSTLPAELEALRSRGRDELAGERVRMTEATRQEREKLLERTRREIDMQYRAARRDLVEHTADLAIGLARARIARTITPDDQARLIDRYAGEVRL